jgi:predicted membrane protein (TIGR00267 family)
MTPIKKFISLIRIGEAGGIAKRYMVMNSFDGSLTALGIIIGAMLADVTDAKMIILAGLGASIAMGVSGSFGAYLTESAVKKEELEEKQAAMLEEINNTILDQAAEVSSIFVAVVDGLSPFLAATFSILPFFGTYLFSWSLEVAFIGSIILTSIALFILGAYLGQISSENKLYYGLRMVVAGIITAILVLFLEILSEFT